MIAIVLAGTIIYYYHKYYHVYRNSSIFFRFTVIFIKLLGTTTYMSSPMHGLYKMPELAILMCLVLANNLIDAVHECTFSNEL